MLAARFWRDRVLGLYVRRAGAAAGGEQIVVSAGYDYACALSDAGAVSCWMIYNGAADVPTWLREPAMPITGSGGLLNSGPNRQKIALAALAGLGASVLSLLVLLALRRGRALR